MKTKLLVIVKSGGSIEDRPMSHGEVSAWHYATRKPVCIRWEDGRITSVERAGGNTPRHVWIAPTLFDLQVNGYGGVDFQQDAVSVDQVLCASRALRRDGCARFLLTLITDDWGRLMARLRRFREIRAQSAELQSAIIGWHIEGPFLSEQPGFHGAHDPSLMCDPAKEHIRELRHITGDDPVLLTVAPERTGAIEAIELASSLGIIVSLGHTNASAELLAKAVKAGAKGFTHLGNGCPRELDRHDNILWRVFETAGLTASLIPDAIHVSPALFRIAHKVLAADALYYTTDAMSAGGAPPGTYRLGSMEFEVGPDQVVRQPGRTNFAGSALRPIDGIIRAAAMLQCSWQTVWDRFSIAPARLMGMENRLAAGQPADFCVFHLADDGSLDGSPSAQKRPIIAAGSK